MGIRIRQLGGVPSLFVRYFWLLLGLGGDIPMVTGRPGRLAPARGGEEKEKREIVCTPFRFKTAMFPLKDIHLCSGSGSRPAAAPPRLQRTLHRPCDPNLFANLMRFFFDFRFFLDSSCQYPTWYPYHTASDLARAADISTSPAGPAGARPRRGRKRKKRNCVYPFPF